MRCAALLLVFVGGCAGSSTTKNNQYFSLKTSNSSNQMALSSSGNVVGPNIQLSPTDSGYRGMAQYGMVDLRSDGEHISGTINNRAVDMHVTLTGDGLRARGTFAGQLGRIDASNTSITSNIGYCTYDLEARGQAYVGQRACGRTGGGGWMPPMAHPAALELPAGFERLRPDRQAMLLAIMLVQ